MNSIYAEAMLRLLPSEEGGLERPTLTETRGLLLKFETDDGGEVQLGAVVQLRGCHRLLPGEEGSVQLHFWADEARIYATAGARFRAWHGRDVGEGRIITLHDHEDDTT